MAVIKEELIIIKVSSIEKTTGSSPNLVTEEVLTAIEAVVSELLGSSGVVEVVNE